MTRRRGSAGGKAPDTPSRPATAGRSTAPRRRQNTPAPSRDDNDGVPQVYQEMLSEAHPSSRGSGTHAESSESGQHRSKRRKVGERPEDRSMLVSDRRASGTVRGDHAEAIGAEDDDDVMVVNKPAAVQTVYDVDASDESGMEWEDVILEAAPTAPAELPGQQPGGTPALATDGGGGEAVGEESLQITLEPHGGKEKQKAPPRRKPATALEKKRRLETHKVHLLCLISHVQMRNSWCNDEEVQKTLKPMLSKHTILCLNPRPGLPQFSRSTTFADGLKQAADTFRRRYKVAAPGMRRPYWLEKPETFKSESVLAEGAEIMLSKSDFRTQAATYQGSRDLGAQLFCTLLRGVGVETRLVCSLQVLPFSGVAKGESPRKPEREYIVLSDAESSSANTRSPTPASQSTPARSLRQPQFLTKPSTKLKTGMRLGHSPGISDSPYPVFWIEAFNDAMQRWVAVDPLATNTVGKPGRLEPPSADRYNNMNYVIGFEDDLSARDVTRRYVKSFNSKTRKTRVEQTKGGENWWDRTMRVFERPFLEDRDQLEFGELTSKAASEGMPRNVQDFKDHPIYALERHLRRNEVIHPKREIGKVGLSKSTPSKKGQQLESVYRRADVCIAKSANGWYRQGRSVKPGEQPIKRVPVSRNKGSGFPSGIEGYSDDDEGDAQDTPMYGEFQTELYKPSPVVDGQVPRNNYGNIDVYTPSMVPEGGFHLKHLDAAMAARILGVSYADAVTGFKFKGRHGEAVTEGIVAAVEYKEALYAVLSGLDDERAQAEQDRRTKAALRMWKQLMVKLRVAERIESYTFEGDDKINDGGRAKSGSPDDLEGTGGGGFFPEDGPAYQSPAINPASLYTGFEGADIPPGDVASPEHETVPHGASSRSFGHEVTPGPPPTARSTNRGENLPSPRPKPKESQGSRYNLVVVPKRTDPTQATDPTTHHPSNVVSEEQPSQKPQIQSPPPTDPQPSRAETANDGPVIGSSATAPIDIESSAAEGSVSVEEAVGLPELVHGDSESEVSGSMISHDPEDDDAEPEWLLSD